MANGTMNSVSESQASLADLKRSTRNTVHDCLALQEFYTGSRMIFAEIASRADEKHQGAYALMVQESLPKANINSALVCVVSDIYHALRLIEEKIRNHGRAEGETMWEAPASFQRSTTKYWVKDENLTKLTMICAMEAPLLVYGMKGPLTSTKPRDVKVSDGDKLWDSLATVITSIYFDSSDMSLYKERLKRAQGAKLLRVRWYGNKMPTGDKIIFVELKTHHEKWVGNKSVKERASIKEKDMLEFLAPVHWTNANAEAMVLRAKPKMEGEALAKATDLLMRMHKLVVKHKLTACVRSVYDRAAFQSAKNNDLRLTLDRNVTVVNERAKQLSEGKWCLTDEEAQTARSCVVPFNVFEVKLAKDGPMPPGLASAVNDSTIELATKFSKFLTGAAAFNSVPTLPYWAAHPAFYSFFELDKRSLSSSSLNASGTPEGDYSLMDSVAGIFSKGVSIAPKFPARIEPKTYFANERTFIQWVSASILLLSISGFLLKAGHDYGPTAALISFASLCLVMYSTHLYFARLNLLKAREPYGYFNKVNPIFLASVVGLAIFLIWADSIAGDDIVGALSFAAREGKDRRFLRTQFSGQILHQRYNKFPQEFVATKPLINENLSSLVVDSERHSFLMTSNDSVFIQSKNDDGTVRVKAESLIRINQSHLRGLAIIGDRLFAVSDGDERTELIEMAWWRTREGSERLQVVGRWTLQDSRSQINGFSFAPPTDSTPTGSFHINMNSSIRVYSVPSRSESEEQGHLSHPMKLKSLNMKVLMRGLSVGDQEHEDHLSTMVNFECITYILRSNANVLEAWNLLNGTHVSEIKLPAIDTDSGLMVKWAGFALERKVATGSETANVRGGDVLFLHLLTVGGQIWSFPVLEQGQTFSGLFSVPTVSL
eukprot:scaffold5_cov169-Amphora_coffeaeformis.AAC.4